MGFNGRTVGAGERGGIGEGGADREQGSRRVGLAGGENMESLVGDVPEYGTGCRRWGGGDGHQSVLGRITSGTDKTP